MLINTQKTELNIRVQEPSYFKSWGCIICYHWIFDGTAHNKLFYNGVHTAPDWCQPEVFGTLNFSAVLIVCDQDKIIHVDQQIL